MALSFPQTLGTAFQLFQTMKELVVQMAGTALLWLVGVSALVKLGTLLWILEGISALPDVERE